MKTLFKVLAVITVLACFTCIMIYVKKQFSTQEKLTLTESRLIDLTPTAIREIRKTGQWEFITIDHQEIIDTVKYGFWGDDRLIRVYYGTLRLGLDLKDTKPDWVEARHDTLVVHLPQIRLLDNDFIDEARTLSFFEKGDWSHTDRAKLYRIATAKMTKKCLNEQNLLQARNNAAQHFAKMFRAMGFKIIRIKWQDGTQQEFDDKAHIYKTNG